MSEYKNSQLESFSHRMTKRPFVCSRCQSKPSIITTTNSNSMCFSCYWEVN